MKLIKSIIKEKRKEILKMQSNSKSYKDYELLINEIQKVDEIYSYINKIDCLNLFILQNRNVLKKYKDVIESRREVATLKSIIKEKIEAL